MSNIDKQALRQLATDAHELGIIKRYTKGVEANRRFVAAANPLVVRALLDDNDKLLREKDAMEATALALRDDMRLAREKLEAAEKRTAEQADIIAKQEQWIKDIEATMIAATDRAEAAEKRIAELEAREVELPPLVDCSNVPFAAYSWNAYRAEAVKALRAAGITVKGG